MALRAAVPAGSTLMRTFAPGTQWQPPSAAVTNRHFASNTPTSHSGSVQRYRPPPTGRIATSRQAAPDGAAPPSTSLITSSSSAAEPPRLVRT